MRILASTVASGALLLALTGCQGLTSAPDGSSPASAPPSPAASSSAPVTASQVSGSDQVSGVVTRVVDGDTLDVDTGGAEPLRVRVLGIDTQETYGGEECWGAEASAYAREVLADQRVRLRSDPAQGDTDRYGRSLRYVILPNGDNYSLLAVRSGSAYYAEDYPVALSPELIVAEARAREADRGLWGPPCWGRTGSPATG